MNTQRTCSTRNCNDTKVVLNEGTQISTQKGGCGTQNQLINPLCFKPKRLWMKGGVGHADSHFYHPMCMKATLKNVSWKIRRTIQFEGKMQFKYHSSNVVLIVLQSEGGPIEEVCRNLPHPKLPGLQQKPKEQ